MLGTAVALTVAGASAATATTTAPEIDHEARTVSVTFELEEGQSSDLCGAALAPAGSAPRVASEFADGDIQAIFRILTNDPEVIVLKSGRFIRLPFVSLSRGFLGNPVGTVSADEVPPNVYGLVSICVSDPESPDITPVVIGGPLEAAQGSLEKGSAELGMFAESLWEEFGS